MKTAVGRALISPEALQSRVSALAEEIVASLPPSPADLTLVAVLSGSIIFLADLMRRLPMKMRLGLVTVSSYRGRATQPGPPRFEATALPSVAGRDVLIVDDVLDTGGTLRLVQREVSTAGARSVRTAVLLRKNTPAAREVAVDFVGFDIEDVFVVGYGLDYDGLYRNLPYIAELTREENTALRPLG
ncbi:MAG: hypoxanthine phosphoribosyltransferase [Planctomycetota bacterium]|nr:MAG: hypoxanthine phosphoribosyltransferase [Planctomycetota bacterium]